MREVIDTENDTARKQLCETLIEELKIDFGAVCGTPIFRIVTGQPAHDDLGSWVERMIGVASVDAFARSRPGAGG